MQKIKNICVSDKKGKKSPVKEALIIENFGIQGDFHSKPDSLRQISFLTEEIIEEFKNKGVNVIDGDFGENIILTGIDITKIEVGGFISIGDAKIEVTKIGKDCPTPCIIYKTVGICIMPLYGIFGKVLKGGLIKIEDSFSYSK
ncbi:MAG: hypothetical protein A2086_09885 [Spirochaetes bacterium GWD1_27_9]|nr:MAG: hypothetical protein A2Z98_10415 [Spirochaetes bacterium GWB1_27_13]OHD26503.1 MAG: hypothetical protein A2Y34_12890 [Spirochaetes bacterium GWC1_27_15]OHD42044.1 MAG: hypothetical protein A2086_09885 [Spirochaetes bacterium GWD1_27_9]